MSIFDAEAKNYDKWYETPAGRFVDETETALAFGMFKPASGAHILDAGCGTGNFSLKLAKMGLKVTGVDFSEGMLKQAEKKMLEAKLPIEFEKGDLYRLNYEDESFDAVISMAAFEFLKEPQKAFKELMRVVKKGGRILIGTINRDSSWGELYQSEEFREHTVFRHAAFKTMDEMEALEPDCVLEKGYCLFVPPGAPETSFCREMEDKLSKTERGGYLCLLWKK